MSLKSPYWIIAGLIALVHFPLLLMDGVYWDDWVLQQFIFDGDTKGHFLLWDELGLPGYASIYWLIGSLTSNPVIGHNIVTFLLLITSALLIFRIGKTFELTSFESGIVAVTSAVYCALETTFVFNVTVYYLMFTAFLLAANIAFEAKKASEKKAIQLRALALFLFAFSSQHNSLLVFFGAFMLLMLLYEHRRCPLTLRECVTTFPRKHADYIILPLAFWGIDNALHPRVEYYNRFNLSWHNIQSGILAFISKGLMEQLREVIREIAKYPAALCAFTVAGLVAWWKKPSGELLSKRNVGLMILLCGIVLFAFGTAPYIVVSKGARAHGYTTRHALLVALPVGVMVLGVIKMLWERGKVGQLVATVLMSAAFAGSTLAFWGVYDRWQVRWIKDRSIITYFEDNPELKSTGTYIIEDNFKPTVESYRYYEWAGMIRRAWGIPGYLVMREDESYETIAEIEAYHPNWKEWYHLAGYPRNPCRANLFIEPGEADSLEYLKTRFWGTEEEMKTLLRKATVIDYSKYAGCND